MFDDFSKGTIISTARTKQISPTALITELEHIPIIYIGETHVNPEHHKIQLQLIKKLFDAPSELSVGIEMVDYSYQDILDRWTQEELDETAFLEKTHWYANWKFDFELYRDIFLFIKEHRIPLFGLNIPFHIPPKIAVGGISNLRPFEKKWLPETIDTTNAEHRAFLEKIYAFHHKKRRNNFDYFYTAQCVWEDIMAESIAKNLSEGKMIVLAGSGHISRKFGIPDRTYRRTQKPFKTILPISPGDHRDLSEADYFWITSDDETNTL